MTYHSPITAFVPHHPARIAILRCRDDFHMDPAPLTAMFASHSEKDAEAMVCRALEDMALRLDRLQAARRAGDYAEIPHSAKRIAAIAAGLGLTEVKTVAKNIAQAAESGCGIALGAVTARMERCFDTAVSQVWEFRRYN